LSGRGRAHSQTVFLHPPHRTGLAPFSASGSPGIHVPPPRLLSGLSAIFVRHVLNRLRRSIVLNFIRNFVTSSRAVSSHSACESPGPLRHVDGFPVLRLLWGLRRPYASSGTAPSTYGPPTFTLMHSTEAFRRQLISDPSRSLRNPDRTAGTQVYHCHPLDWYRRLTSLGHPLESAIPLDAVAAPSGKVLRQGFLFPWVFRYFVYSPWASSAKPGILTACLASHRYLSGPALSPLGCIPQALRPNGSSPACTGGGDFLSLHQCASWRTQIEEPIMCRYSPAFHFYATLTRMLGPTLIGHQVVEVCQPYEKRLLAATGMMEPLHRE
jgi:hypothetical protein